MKEIRDARPVYKYRSCDIRTLGMLLQKTIHYSAPQSFNDPWDVSPVIGADLRPDAIEEIWKSLYLQRSDSEFKKAAMILKMSAPTHQERLAQLREKAFTSKLQDIYNQFWDEGDRSWLADEASLSFYLCREVLAELLQRYDMGVVSLASRPDCPLMWSHYSDQHRGVCLGYSLLPKPGLEFVKVRYGTDRRIPVSRIRAMIDGDIAARDEVRDRVLGVKALPWQYEEEWRLVGTRGLQPVRMDLNEVIFGMRCELPEIKTYIAALSAVYPKLRFSRCVDDGSSFDLKRRIYEEGEIQEILSRTLVDPYEVFGSIPSLLPPDAIPFNEDE